MIEDKFLGELMELAIQVGAREVSPVILKYYEFLGEIKDSNPSQGYGWCSDQALSKTRTFFIKPEVK
jgi:hypothetical protein